MTNTVFTIIISVGIFVCICGILLLGGKMTKVLLFYRIIEDNAKNSGNLRQGKLIGSYLIRAGLLTVIAALLGQRYDRALVLIIVLYVVILFSMGIMTGIKSVLYRHKSNPAVPEQ
jgi:hypothetical protein